MTPVIYKATGVILKAMGTVIHSHIRVHGREHLSDHPTLFVPNHFTRAETFLLPYALYQYHRPEQVRCLASSELFVGKLGDYLHSLGALSISHLFRNRIIISDLIAGRHNWVIYPEGLMVKNKKVVDKNGRLVIDSPQGKKAPRTGSAVLALKGEWFRQAIKREEKRRSGLAHNILNRFELQEKEVADLNITITPVNITYYPLRPAENPISRIGSLLLKDLPESLSEELQVEGKLLLNADIDITFCPAIDLGQYTRRYRPLFSLPLIEMETKINWLVGLARKGLTRRFMRTIYENTTVNLDHLFAYYLYHSPTTLLSLPHLRAFLVMAAQFLHRHAKNGHAPKRFFSFNRHPSVDEKLVEILIAKEYPPLTEILSFAEKEGILVRDGEDYRIEEEFLKRYQPFHLVRLENIFQVMLNEILPLRPLVRYLRRLIRKSLPALEKKMNSCILKMDRRIYLRDYRAYFEEGVSKGRSRGAPFYLRSRRRRIGIVLSHGYKANPREVQDLGKFLSRRGYAVYGIRLKGHGTAPSNMKEIIWEEWMRSYQRGIAAVAADFDQVIFGGFSTGGLLALLAAARYPHLVRGVFSINAPVKLQDIKARFVPAINVWNDLLEKTHIQRGKLEYVEDIPEFPDTNYRRNYLKGVEELGKLMKICYRELPSVISPTMIVQARQDPIVDSRSAQMLHRRLRSPKCLQYVNMDRHVIVRGDGSEAVFKFVSDFIEEGIRQN